MSRELKFRVWSLKNKIWINHCALLDCYNNLLNCFYNILDNGNTVPNITLLKKEDFVIQQYTGLKDKNNIEIFEGDILSTSYYKWNSKTEKHDIFSEKKIIGEVLFGQQEIDTGITGFGEGRGSFISVGFYVKHPKWSQIECVHSGYEVEGNIFQNQELLKQ